MTATLIKAILLALQLAPTVIAGINNIASSKDHASKRDMAHNALTLASGVAAAVDPKDTATIQNVSDLVHGVIDLHLGAAPAPVAAPAS